MIQEVAGFDQVGSIETFAEPMINRGEDGARLTSPTGAFQLPGKGAGGAEFE